MLTGIRNVKFIKCMFLYVYHRCLFNIFNQCYPSSSWVMCLIACGSILKLTSLIKEGILRFDRMVSHCISSGLNFLHFASVQILSKSLIEFCVLQYYVLSPTCPAYQLTRTFSSAGFFLSVLTLDVIGKNSCWLLNNYMACWFFSLCV